MCDQPDLIRRAVLGDAAQDVAVVPDAQLDLHGRDVGDVPRFLDLSDGHVAEANLFDEAITLQRGQRPHARGQRRPWIRCVQLIQGNPVGAECPQAGFARRAQMTGASVRNPAAVRARQAAFGRDDDAGWVAGPGRERTSDEPLVVTGLMLVPAVRVGRVEERDAGVERGMQDLDTAPLVSAALRRETHAPEANQRTRNGRWPHGSSARSQQSSGSLQARDSADGSRKNGVQMAARP